MKNSPEVSRWYAAELTEEVTLEDDPLHVIHRKTRVIFADSAEDAYQEALSMIREQEVSHQSESNRGIRTRFWELRELIFCNEDRERVGAQPRGRTREARRRNSTGLSPERQFALMSLKPGGLPN